MKGKAVADVRWVALQPGCRLLLCSDGLTNMLGDADIAELLGAGGSADAACRTLVERAIRAGGHDNITVIVIDIG
jgi:protein phosphatase